MNELLAYLTENCCGRGVTVRVPVCNPVKRHPELTPWRHEELTPQLRN